jgi:hypothetical protein
MSDTPLLQRVSRIETEFTALPGLKLTFAQVNRLCNMPTDVCESASDALTRSGFLNLSGDSFFLLGCRRHQRRAVIA